MNNDRNNYLQAWSKMMIDIWMDKMAMYNIRDTGQLMNSLEESVQMNSNSDIDKITHTFLYYGRMVDMGVGKGVKLSEVNDGTNRRKKKKWLNKSYFFSVMILNRKMAELYSEEFRSIIVDTLKD